MLRTTLPAIRVLLEANETSGTRGGRLSPPMATRTFRANDMKLRIAVVFRCRKAAQTQSLRSGAVLAIHTKHNGRRGRQSKLAAV